MNRRDFLGMASLLAATPLLARCSPAVPGETPPVAEVPPQRLRSEVIAGPDGAPLRSFSGAAAPQDLSFTEATTGEQRRLYELFPRGNCPFGIDGSRQLGAGGFGLSIVDRTLAGQLPEGALWALNMVPFGVAIDGVLLDPSGPWFDGGPADPKNPFDRGCSGWEYDPIFRTVAELVGVPEQVRGHVQPGPGGMPGSPGLFHYHGVPGLMLGLLRRSLTQAERAEPLVVGYSADGYWILDAVIPAEATSSGKRLHLFSGYTLREGARSALPRTNPALVPPGAHDGTFVQDWVFDPERKRAQIEAALAKGEYNGLLAADVEAGRASFELLDARNGLITEGFRLPGAPARAYAYALTPDWPEIPRWFASEPSASFRGVIPLGAQGQMGPPGRHQLYEACGADLADVHRWEGRPPY